MNSRSEFIVEIKNAGLSPIYVDKNKDGHYSAKITWFVKTAHAKIAVKKLLSAGLPVQIFPQVMSGYRLDDNTWVVRTYSKPVKMNKHTKEFLITNRVI